MRGLADLVSMVDAGELRVRVGACHHVDYVHRAHREFEAGGLVGKVVLTFQGGTTPMSESEEDVRELLAGARHAVVGVNRAGGPPQLSVVWFIWDGQSFRVSTTRSRAKYLNLKRDPAISLLIDDFEKKFYVVAYGRAQLIEDNHDALAQPLIEKYMPERSADAQWTPDRVIVELRPDRLLTGR